MQFGDVGILIEEATALRAKVRLLVQLVHVLSRISGEGRDHCQSGKGLKPEGLLVHLVHLVQAFAPESGDHCPQGNDHGQNSANFMVHLWSIYLSRGYLFAVLGAIRAA